LVGVQSKLRSNNAIVKAHKTRSFNKIKRVIDFHNNCKVS